MIELFSYTLTYSTAGMLLFTAFLIGMSKTGVAGVALFTIPIMAIIFGGKDSSGLMLPLLVMADLFAVTYYRRHVNWSYLVKLFPSAAVGVILATLIGNYIDDQLFRSVMGIIIFVSLAIMLWMETANKNAIPDYMWFAILMGLLGGFTSMIGNLAAAVMALYLLSMRLPKNEYIGTGAWFFLAVNVFKVPFHVFAWHTISLNSFYLNVALLPIIALGAFVGIRIVRIIPEKQYRWLILAATGIAAIIMVI
ncbi:sulfite exporter TauE/SafE family protein [Paraglaciecola agarilytica]|uniref:Probable membrane transporter protein n=1 Tax=Paraglaciecola chathamensis TaxID=368405 RepID=A0ABS0WBJ9_9ALTE|nr:MULTISPECIES: sulfite exporter TauE/SafE family protein [Paraglaciecola]MBJ2135862.1 sulfite exporter TauE/SafE family protein [Paraglaciecola chathamensis]MBU3017524.1 sulfite exporter TauE/SafE family protein [Paraglaciecola agarilytica]MDO6561274.1 sulfite exporter TauE/SafE family protein [Paraglaciecola chathamensis]